MKSAPMKLTPPLASFSITPLVVAGVFTFAGVVAFSRAHADDASSADGAKKPLTPTLTRPFEADPKGRPAPTDYSKPSGDVADKPAFADNGTGGDGTGNASGGDTSRTTLKPVADKPQDAVGGAAANADQAKQLEALQRRLAMLENVVDMLQMQIRKEGEANLKTHKETAEALKAITEGLKQQNDSLAKVTADFKQVKEDVAAATDANARLARTLDNIQIDMTTLTTDLKGVRKDLDGVTADIAQMSKELSSTLSHYAKYDPATGRWRRIRPYSQSESPGKDGAPVNVDVIPRTQGKLVLINRDTVAEKVLQINGTSWRVRTGRSYIWVPVGTVSIANPGDRPEFVDEWRHNAVSGQMELTYEF